MSVFSGPEMVNDGLVLQLDAGNARSYPGSGTSWTDLSGNGNTGTLTNGPTFDANNGGSIVLASASSNYVNIPNSTSTQITGDLTIMFWFMPYNYAAGRQGILGRSGLNEYTITMETGGTVSFYFSSANQAGSYYNGASFKGFGQTNNVWQQLVVTRNWTTNRVLIYKNAGQTASSDLTGVSQPTATSGPTGIGNGNGGFFNGRVAMFNLYNRALTAAEIAQNFNATRGRYGI